MSVEIINARSDPTVGGPPPYYQQSRRYQRSGKTDAQIKAFCEGYSIHGTITGAAKHAGVDPNYHYKWLECDPEYQAEFKIAYLRASEALVAEARRRAKDGVEEPTGWYKGEPGGFVKKYSDALLMFLIKGAFPDIYKDRHEHTGKNGGPIEVQSTVAIEGFPSWWKQATVVIGSGVQIDSEMERMLQEYFEAKFLEAEKLVGSGTASQPINQPNQLVVGLDQSEPIVEMVSQSVVEASQSVQSESESDSEPNRDWRPAKRTTLDMDDI